VLFTVEEHQLATQVTGLTLLSEFGQKQEGL